MLKDIWRVLTGRLSWQMVCDTQYKLQKLDSQNTSVIRALREMDQLVFQMGQCADWESMRKRFVLLQGPTEERMRAESKRIEALLIPEIKKVYNEPNR